MSPWEQPNQHESKQSLWEAERRAVLELRDRQSLGVDEGIVEPLVALRLMGVKTIASCEGHGDSGLKAPWIDIGAEVPPLLDEEMRRADDSHDEERAHGVWEQIHALHLQEASPVLTLLDDFYRSQPTPADLRLVMLPAATYVRLISQGGIFQESRSDEIAARMLRQYQDEMHRFSMYLKTQFMSR
jgi:hypothetical protein